MAIQPVEWVLIVKYNISAHRATYGRLSGTTYTKDFIQLSRKEDFMNTVTRLFPVSGGVGSVPLTYQWPSGSTQGAFVFLSADRPHLKWETSLGAPKAWKMSLHPSENSAETILGDPSHLDVNAADNEFEQLANRGGGQPYLFAIKLRDEPFKLHLRTYLGEPSTQFEWAKLTLLPEDIQALANGITGRGATAWSTFQSGGTPPASIIEAAISQINEGVNYSSVIDALNPDSIRAFAEYLLRPGYGIFFDPSRNHDAWLQTTPFSESLAASSEGILRALYARFPQVLQDDAAAELLESDPEEVQALSDQIALNNYEVSDSTATSKTRGSAQQAFAKAVKSNYGMQCAITGIKSQAFLVAAHIVPWSKDQTIRLDPSNGICLSLLVDRAFEKGYLLIDDDLTIRIDRAKVGDDDMLGSDLGRYDGTVLNVPADGSPKIEYLQRRRTLVAAEN
jgi:hypothetical protein